MDLITHQPHLLVVENDQNAAILIKSILESSHFVAHTFEDPFLALEVLKDDPVRYNALIYDMAIKEMSAFEFLRHAREVNPDIKFFLITTIEINPAEFIKVLPTINIDGFIEKHHIKDRLIPVLNKSLGTNKIAKSNTGKYR